MVGVGYVCKAINPIYHYQNTIDSIYNTMSLLEKIEAIVLSDNNDSLPSTNSTLRHILRSQTSLKQAYDKAHFWVDLDYVFNCAEVSNTIQSDNLMRSAFMKNDNIDLQKWYTDLLKKMNLDGFYYSLNSPYSLLFTTKETSLVNYFLKPQGRALTPYETKSGDLMFYATDVFSYPDRMMSSHKIDPLEEQLDRLGNLSESSTLSSSIRWLDYQHLKEELGNPSVQSILLHGGLFYSERRAQTIQDLLRVFARRILDENALEKSCKNSILSYLLQQNMLSNDTYHTTEQLADNIQTIIYHQGEILLQNNDIIPINHLSDRSVLVVNIGEPSKNEFTKQLQHYLNFETLDVSAYADISSHKIQHAVNDYNTIILNLNEEWLRHGNINRFFSEVKKSAKNKDVILVCFGDGECLKQLEDKSVYKSVLLAFENTDKAQIVAGQILMGGIGAKGTLPYNIGKTYSFSDGIVTSKCRLGYANDYYSANPDSLANIDKIVYQAIRERATPGCQVLVAKDGNIIYNKSFGYFTYDKKRHINNNNLYDIASITKITASIPSLMALVDEGTLNVTDSLAMHLPRLKGSNKQGLILSDMLVHQAGLLSWIPFYMRTIDKDKLQGKLYSNRYSSTYNIRVDKRLYMNKTVRYRNDIFRSSPNSQFSIQVCDKMYMNKDYLDSIQLAIDTSEIKLPAKYRYSDLAYYYYKEIIESKYQQPIESFVQERFYKPLGADRLTYLPLEKFSQKEIVPTENDLQWRKELVDGYVHDPGAAMLGGVGGHAGLFSNAESLAKVMQMYLQEGSYGGEEFISKETIKLFTSVYKEGNRRGLGFDKPELDPEKGNPACPEAGPLSFGHSGFTGTLVWVDPEYNLIYIFLSNRIHPRQYNKKLISTNVRTRIHSAIYHSLPEFHEKQKELEEAKSEEPNS